MLLHQNPGPWWSPRSCNDPVDSVGASPRRPLGKGNCPAWLHLALGPQLPLLSLYCPDSQDDSRFLDTAEPLLQLSPWPPVLLPCTFTQRVPEPPQCFSTQQLPLLPQEQGPMWLPRWGVLVLPDSPAHSGHWRPADPLHQLNRLGVLWKTRRVIAICSVPSTQGAKHILRSLNYRRKSRVSKG